LRICLACVLALWLPFAVWAQADTLDDFDFWSSLAAQVEDALDEGGASDDLLTILRERVVEFRANFDAASSQNAARIATVREQINSLGPEPASDSAETEAPDVAAQRADLNEQLATLLVPVQRAEAAFVRADRLVSQIDQTLRERQAEQLLTMSPTPLNPTYWTVALSDFMTAGTTLLEEPPEMGAMATRKDLAQTLPVAAVMAIVGLVFLFKGLHWSTLIVQRLQHIGGRGFGVWRFLVSLLRIILPFAGMLMVVLAAIRTGVLGPQLAELLFFIVLLSGIMLGLRWVSERVFSRDEDEVLLPIPSESRTKLRFHVSLITVFIALKLIVEQILQTSNPAPATVPVLVFPFLLLAALSLYRIGVILRSYREEQPEDTIAAELRTSTLGRVVRGLGTGAVIVTAATPILLAAGYYRAADALLPPYFMTLAIFGLVMALQRFAADVYGAVTGQGAQAREALMPVLFGMLLVIAVSPLLALIWGARVTDLTELWAAFGRGFAIGESRISPTDFVAFIVIFAIGYVLTRIIQSTLKNNVLPKTKMDIGGQNAIVSGLGYVGIFLAALAAITGVGLDLSSLAIVAGALSVGIGFGLQTIVSNFVSGIILLIERPISEGDWIEVGGQMGYVRDISVRSTRIETFDKTDVIVPNADLVSGTVTNFTRGNTVGRLIVPVGVAYGNDTRRIEKILQEIAGAQPMVLATPAPNILFLNFGADALEFEIRCFLRDVNWMMVVKSNINHDIAKRFAAEGIEIPFAQRDLWLRNPEVLGQDASEIKSEPIELPTQNPEPQT